MNMSSLQFGCVTLKMINSSNIKNRLNSLLDFAFLIFSTKNPLKNRPSSTTSPYFLTSSNYLITTLTELRHFRDNSKPTIVISKAHIHNRIASHLFIFFAEMIHSENKFLSVRKFDYTISMKYQESQYSTFNVKISNELISISEVVICNFIFSLHVLNIQFQLNNFQHLFVN